MPCLCSPEQSFRAEFMDVVYAVTGACECVEEDLRAVVDFAYNATTIAFCLVAVRFGGWGI
jgi:hypothetical protein